MDEMRVSITTDKLMTMMSAVEKCRMAENYLRNAAAKGYVNDDVLFAIFGIEKGESK